MRHRRPPTVATIPPEWNPAQDRAARLMALGYTQQMVADELQVTLRTVQNWCAIPGFYVYVDELAAMAWTRVEPRLMANIELALDVQRRMLLGEIDAKSPRYVEARSLINVVIRLLTVRRDTQTPADNPDLPPPIDVQRIEQDSPASA